jgi:hypothetical protein
MIGAIAASMAMGGCTSAAVSYPTRPAGGQSTAGQVSQLPSVAASLAAAASDSPSGSAMACPTQADPTKMSDPTSGFQLLMPSNWRNLPAGDPLWVTVYGDHESSVEADVASGTITDYALPAVPADADNTVNLAVYVRPNTTDETLGQLADGYVATLGGYSYPLLARESLSLAAGPAIRLTATRPASDNNPAVDDQLVIYILAAAGRAYYLIFVSQASTSAQYGGTFLCMAQSLNLATP